MTLGPENMDLRPQLQALKGLIADAREQVHMGSRLPATVRNRRLKKLMLRAARLISLEQVGYNRAVVAALTEVADRLHDLERRLDNLERRADIEHESRKADQTIQAIVETQMDGVAAHPQPAARPAAVRASRRAGTRPRLVSLSTFRVGRQMNGGELRAYNLCRALAQTFDVEIVSLGRLGEVASQAEISPGVVETVVPRSLAHHAAELAHQQHMGLEFPLGDILAPDLLRFTPDFVEAARTATNGAAAVQLEHPYLFPTLEMIGCTAPVIYDAHNAELVMKAAMLPATAEGAVLLERVRDVEAATVAAAALVATCSKADADALCGEYGSASARWVDVPNGVDLDSVACTTGTRRQAARMAWISRFQAAGGALAGINHCAVFIASGHPPSWEAAEAVIAAARELPSVGFFLVGTHALRFRQRLLPDNVVAVGPLADFGRRVLMGCVDMGLNPMLSGGGSNLKVPGYFAAGVPVVATPFGVRGFDVVDGEHVLICEPGGLADAIDEVRRDPQRAERLALAGRRLVEDRYQWAGIGARLTDAVADVTGGAA
ncbi:MAG: glycosyltransferase [Candidatus Dormibacteria bacterium]